MAGCCRISSGDSPGWRMPPLDPDFRLFAVVVLDGAGIGFPPGADAAGGFDRDADTIGHVVRTAGPLELDDLAALGLGLLKPEIRLPVGRRLTGAALRMIPLSAGKDSLTGHWELAGLPTNLELKTYPAGFPPELLAELAGALGRGLLGGKPASGTEIIRRLGPEHMDTGKPIVYTSADSVLQIAAHEDVVRPDELYRMCRAAREVATGRWLVGRVIARPFLGSPGAFVRTAGRRDFSLPPPGPTVLSAAQAAGVEVVAVGKVGDVFSGRGIDRSIEAHTNDEVISALRTCAARPAGTRRRLIFANLNDFDSRYGHRRDPVGFARGLEDFDRALPGIIRAAQGSGRSILAVTADHGCDPTYPGSDHTREAVPLLLAGTGWPAGFLGTVTGLHAVAGLISAAFGLEGFGFWPRKEPASAYH